MILKIFRVSGNSLSPVLSEGDFVVTSGLPALMRRLKPNDFVLFRHPAYGTLVKLVDHLFENGDVFVVGKQPDSADSRKFGPVRKADLLGKVIATFRNPLRSTTP